MRIEQDFLGTVELPDEALYGIHAYRAARNFPDLTRFSFSWYKALGSVKRACYLTYRTYSDLLGKKYPGKEVPVSLIPQEILNALIDAAGEVENGFHFEYFIVPAVQGGAGTSINMNINEIIANRALQLSGFKTGDYGIIHPIEHANVFQSTNDVIPTSLKVACLRLLNDLEASVNGLRLSVEALEGKSRNYLRIAYTEMQEAVPTTYGRLFSSYNDALSRDWWRISKCSERIKTVNLGGSAIGSGITVPAVFIRDAARTLQQVTGLPVCRAENLNDATSNLDSLTEVHAILKAHAVNLEKIASDLRLLGSDMFKNRDLHLPKLQTGSSVMPGKVNPVIPEFVVSAVHKVYSNDILISGLCGLGNLELNAYLPVIGHALVESLHLLAGCDTTMERNMISGITLNDSSSGKSLLNSPSITTALVPYVGYVKATALSKQMREKDVDIIEANRSLSLLDENRLLKIISVDNLIREGFSINDIME